MGDHPPDDEDRPAGTGAADGELHVRWTVPSPTPEGEEPAAPWGRPVDEDDGDDDDDVPRPARLPESPSAAVPSAGRVTPPSPADPDEGRRATLVVAVAAVAAAIALLAGALVVVLAVRADDDDDSAPRTTAPPTSATTTVAEGLSGEVGIGSGVVALIPEGALTPDAEISTTALATPTNVGPLVTPIGDTVQITLVEGEQLAPIRLRMPYTPPADLPTVDGVVPDGAVFALHRTGGSWVPLPVTLDEAAGTATFETDSLSPFGLFTWSTAQVRSIAAGVFGGLVGARAGAAAPECDRTGPPSYGVEADEASSLTWCAEEAEDGRPTIKLANTSGHAVTVRWDAGVEATSERSSPLAADLTVVEETAGDAVLVLAPDDTATFTVDQGGTGTIEVAYDGSAHAVTGLLAASQVLAVAAPLMPWGGDVSTEGVTAAMAASRCARDLPADMAVASGAWRAALARCAGPTDLADLLSPAAARPASILLSQLAEAVVGDHGALVEAIDADSLLKVTIEP